MPPKLHLLLFLLFLLLLIRGTFSICVNPFCNPSSRKTSLNLPNPPLRNTAATCRITTHSTTQRKILQINGTAEDVIHFSLCFTNTTTGLSLVDSSSNSAVLFVSSSQSDVSLDRVELDTPVTCHNITATFSFERMVGALIYSLQVHTRTSNIVCQTSVGFIIVGFSIYQVSTVDSVQPGGSGASNVGNTIVSGSSHELRLHYEDLLVTNVLSFHIFIQFADGSNSTSHTKDYLMDMLTHLVVSYDGDATSPVYFGKGCAILRPADQLKTSTCGLGIDVVQISHHMQITLSLRFQPYRDGISLFLFSWDYILQHDTLLSHEECVNVWYISVVGNPPPLVVELYPRTELRRAGGESLTIIMDNTFGSNLRFLRIGILTCLELHGSYRLRPDGLYEAIYITQPGKGTNLPWSFHVSFPEGTSRTAMVAKLELHFAVSYATVIMAIQSIRPGIVRPGDRCVLTGYFDGFDPANANHQVFVGSKTLSSCNIVVYVNAKGTEITFKVPHRIVFGAAYEYFIKVVVNTESTSAIRFAYELNNLVLRIFVYGSSYDATEDIYNLGGCAISRFIASLPSGMPEPETFKWTVTDMADSAHQNLLVNSSNEIPNDIKSLLLFPQIFGSKEGKFEVSASCKINGEDVVSTIIVRKQLKPLIGVTLSKPLPRSISLPDVPLRVAAVVMTPRTECYNHSAKVIYRWSYGDETLEFSYRNYSEPSQNMLSTPSKLGREYIIPQSMLTRGNLSVSLFAYMEDEPSVSGHATTSFEVFPAALAPVIGYGSSKILHSIATDLVITAEKSYDPDGMYLRNSSKVSRFEWECQVLQSLTDTTNFEICKANFLPNKNLGSFVINKTSLVSKRDELVSEGMDGVFFIQYSLMVSTEDRKSVESVQTVEVTPEDFAVAKLDDLRVLDNRGNAVKWQAIRYYDDLLIAPEGEDVSWAFQVISPVSSSQIFKQPGNLILHPGYFDPTLPSLTQALPLGIKAGTLIPAQEYEILITLVSSKSGIEKGESRIVLRTEDKPSLILTELPIVHGDLETAFIAFAGVNLDSTYDFQYYFFLIRSDGDESCLGGCNGSPYVQFKCTESGTFQVLVKLMDMQGKTLFDEASYAKNISVSEESFEVSVLSQETSLASFNELLQTIHHQGDHGTFELFVSSLSYRMRSSDVVSYSDSDIEVLDLAVDAMHQIVQNSAPSTMTSKSYVRTATRFASMDAEFFSTQETMYTLFSLVDKAITQMPNTEAFDLQHELLLFYNLSARHVISALVGSTARVRLQQFGSGSGLDARSLLIDMYRLQEEHLTTVLSRDAQCGMVRRLNTIVSDGVPSSDINSFVIHGHSSRTDFRMQPETFDILSTYAKADKKPSHSAFTLAVLCNPDQAKGIRGEATTFQWCDEVFTESGMKGTSGTYGLDPNQKRLFTIMETIDYASLSGIGGDEAQSDTKFLVTINVTVIGHDGVRSLPVPEIPLCYTVNTSMSRLGITASKGCLSAKGFVVQNLGRPFEPKVLMRDLQRNFSTVDVNVSTDLSSTISIISSSPGVFGAIGTDCPFSARKPTLSLPYGEDTDFLYIVFGGVVVALVGVTITWVITSTAFEASSAAATAPITAA